MCLTYRFLVWAGHEAEVLPFRQIHMCGMTESAELFGGFLERVELLEELFFAEFLCRETAFVLVVCIDEVPHGDAPIVWFSWHMLCIYTTWDMTENLSCVLSHVRLLMSASFVFRMR